MKEQTENWILIADYDLKAAKVSFDNELYLKVFENCHSAIEKTIKAVIIESTEKEPPKIHNLLKLISLTLLKNVKEDINKTLDEINDYYMRTRYPDNFYKVFSEIEKEKAEEILNKTKGVIKWLKAQIA